MALTVGARLGPYEILGALGAGGMGEVYRARDTRLDRAVAVKILPAALAADPQFRERFDREARAISQLTHPHICTLYDVGEHDGTAFLVMELLDGETLEEKLRKSEVSSLKSDVSGLRVDEALRIAIQITSALDAAHRRGIVHRDLKPGNIFLVRSGGASASAKATADRRSATREGWSAPPIAKLLDFGLAKASGPAIAGAGLSTLPTTPPNLTAQGTILGTFQYMAPEQLEGAEADTRTDIFAFGAVLYEMLTGRKAFEGKSQASLIGAILKDDPPPLSTLQPLTPPALDRTVKKCLEKEPDRRWQSASDLHDELTWIAQAGSQAGAVPPLVARRTTRERIAWVVAAVALVMTAAIAVFALSVRRAVLEPPPMRFDIPTPPTSEPGSFALSSDGRQLAFVATVDRAPRLWVRPLDQVTAQPLAGTEGASDPFWAPDGRAIGFFCGRQAEADQSGGRRPAGAG